MFGRKKRFLKLWVYASNEPIKLEQMMLFSIPFGPNQILMFCYYKWINKTQKEVTQIIKQTEQIKCFNWIICPSLEHIQKRISVNTAKYIFGPNQILVLWFLKWINVTQKEVIQIIKQTECFNWIICSNLEPIQEKDYCEHT